MNLLHICSYYIGSLLYKNFFEELDKYNVSQIIYVPIDSEKYLNKNRSYNVRKTNYIYSKDFTKIDRFNYFVKINKIFNNLIKQVDLDKIDLIHAHSLFVNGGVAYKLHKKKNIDYIVAVRNTDVNIFFKYAIFLRNLGYEILKNAKYVIFISPAYKEYVINDLIPIKIKDEISKKSIVLPNGIDEYWINNRKNKIVNDLKKINLLYVGQFLKNKNIKTTIEVTKKLKNKGYDVKLKLVGGGKDKNKISNLAKKLGEIIEIHDWTNDKKELIKFYNESDIFIMPSLHETFGLVYIEAMSQGLPLIYSKGQGIDGYFRDGEVGYPVNPTNVDEIIEKIENILKNYEAISKECSKRCSYFRWGNIANKYLEIYKKVVNK